MEENLMMAVQYFSNSNDTNLMTAPSENSVVVKVFVAIINPIDKKVMKRYLIEAGWFSYSEGEFLVGDAVFGVNWGNGSHNCEGR